MEGFKFGWKKTVPSNLQEKSVLPVTNSSDLRTDDEKIAAKGDWRALLRERKSITSENASEKFDRLYDEGSLLAEEGRYWEAIKRWNKALAINPTSEKIHEMQSQVLMELEEIFPAVEAAKKAVHLRPDWPQGRQTLGRSLLNVGQLYPVEVKKKNLFEPNANARILFKREDALKSFMTAEFLDPGSPEFWAEDVKWTITLIEQEKQLMVMDTS